MKGRPLDYGMFALLALIWGSSFMLIKIGVESISPVTVTAGRLSIAAIILISILLVSRQRLPLHRQALKLYFFVGFFGNVLPYTLIGWGEVSIDSSLAAILMGIMPISTFVLAHLALPDEPMTKRRTLGVSLGFCGLITLVGLSALSGLGSSIPSQIAVLGGAISYSVTTIFVRRQPVFSGLEMATGVMIAGALMSLLLMLIYEHPFSINPDVDGLISVAMLGIFPTALATLMYFRVIRNLGATFFSQINYLVPIVGSLLGVIVLDERLYARMAIALLLVLSGIWLIYKKS